MKSSIKIDVDHDNQPIIKVDYVYSEDVRDRLVKKFLETFGGDSCWATFRYENSPAAYGATDRTAIVRPICTYDLPEAVKPIQIEASRHLKSRSWALGVDTDNPPRRAILDQNKPPELAIRKAIEEVEKLGAAPYLTDIVVLLGQALDMTADYIDDTPQKPQS